MSKAKPKPTLERYLHGSMTTAELREMTNCSTLLQWRTGALIPTRRAIEKVLVEMGEPASKGKWLADEIARRCRAKLAELDAEFVR